MKLILSSCDFINVNSKKTIIDNIDKPLKDCKVLFIPNEKATKEKIYSNKYYDRLKEHGFTNKDNIYIFDENKVNDFVNLNLDLIYISGGNTFATLKKIKDCNFDKALMDYIKKGVTFIGGSCGAHIVTKNVEHVLSFDDNYCELKNFDALGLFDGIIIPHYAEKEYEPQKREKIYKEMIKQGKYKVYKLTNDESIVVNDDDIRIL